MIISVHNLSLYSQNTDGLAELQWLRLYSVLRLPTIRVHISLTAVASCFNREIIALVYALHLVLSLCHTQRLTMCTWLYIPDKMISFIYFVISLSKEEHSYNSYKKTFIIRNVCTCILTLYKCVILYTSSSGQASSELSLLDSLPTCHGFVLILTV